MMITMEPDERLERIRRARARFDRARAALYAEIREGLADGDKLPKGEKRKLGPVAVGKAADFSREYIAQIRDGKKQ
jgi:hypothetical protein